ncbi:head maturation protease, ClpP-related [Solimicrobium silvestre]|uniref:ATP-dependent Clp protease proteolytic subunit n=1 Tax=Solimicrobium silvestre TaxID=2099400 RepID=A0A2S9GZF0_9BURK|nr:head maturation protease, ClpP-related [Solimicrobium silvestre]PRC93080.1 Clp protease [Solimicrobium silvestre]
MSLLTLPKINAEARIGNAQFDMRTDALERWEPTICASTDNSTSISIYEQIGESWDGSGMTAARMSGILRNVGNSEIVVNINSPGGDFFEGVAIYNLLREHKAKVTIKVVGLAASAASIIAMAGDEIQMGDGAFLMIHNAWAVAVGNRHDLKAAAETLTPFDEAMADVYAARSGLSAKEAAKLMDAETWLNASKAVEQGFATGLMQRDEITHNAKAQGNTKHLALVEAAMARAGHSRSVRRDTLKSLFSSKPGAAENTVKPSADIAASLQSLLQTMKEST